MKILVAYDAPMKAARTNHERTELVLLLELELMLVSLLAIHSGAYFQMVVTFP